MNPTIMFATLAGSGRFTPVKPTLSYAGSGTTNMGIFNITNYDSSFTYTITGGTRSGSVVTVTNATGSATITARSPKGLVDSASVIAERKAPDQYSYFVQTGAPYCCNDGACASCFGGCGTFYAAGQWCAECGAGFWSCGTPGYTAYAWNNYSGSGYTWSGSNYTNAQGEWWKIV